MYLIIVYTRDVRFENRHGFMSHNEDVPLIGKQMGEVCVMLFVCIKMIQFPYKYIPLPIHFTLIIFDTQQLYCLIFLWIYLTFSCIIVPRDLLEPPGGGNKHCHKINGFGPFLSSTFHQEQITN